MERTRDNKPGKEESSLSFVFKELSYRRDSYGPKD